MNIEILIIGVILLFVINYSGKASTTKFFTDNTNYFTLLKEKDYDFYCAARYGEKVDPNLLYNKRVRNAIMTFGLLIFVFITKLNYINTLFSLLISIVVFKSSYLQLKKYYKNHLHEIDVLLPYYLKSLEILIQHYTVPVAIGKSVEDSPEIFKPGLNRLVERINAGDSSIEPYMDFAKEYPVRDSMRMMRLLYRLSLGSQERKQTQLLTFSRTISNLQAKARETKYSERLRRMENKTMSMLVTTGVGVMILLLLSVLMMFGM